MTEKQGNFTLLNGRVKMAHSFYNPTSDAVWLAAYAPNKLKTVLDVGIGTKVWIFQKTCYQSVRKTYC